MSLEGDQVTKQVVIAPEQGQVHLLGNVLQLRLWPSHAAIMLWTGPEGLAVGGLYLNKPNLFAVTLNIPTFICHFLMRLKWANTNQGFRDSVLISLYEYLCPADSSDSLLNSKFSLKLPDVGWGRGRPLSGT